MSDTVQNGKGDAHHSLTPAFRAHFPEVDWSDKRPARLCANCDDPIDPSRGYVVVGSKYYCDSTCRKGEMKWRLIEVSPPNEEIARTMEELGRAVDSAFAHVARPTIKRVCL